MTNKYLDFNGLNHFTGKIKETYVQKEIGKGLSDENFTAEEKTKLTQLPANAERNVITGIRRNGLIVNPVSRVVDIEVPIRLSELNNDEDFVSRTEVLEAISNSQHMTKEIVDALPATGESFVMYLVPSDGERPNIYEEWLWINDDWEKIGDTATEVDLSGYMKKTDMTAITNAEIDTIFASV